MPSAARFSLGNAGNKGRSAIGGVHMGSCCPAIGGTCVCECTTASDVGVKASSVAGSIDAAGCSTGGDAGIKASPAAGGVDVGACSAGDTTGAGRS